MTLNQAIKCALVALALTTFLALSTVQPVVAQEHNDKAKFIFRILNSADEDVKARILASQQQGIEISLVAKAYHAQALAEYHDAEQALKFGDADLAMNHAMKAMGLFKQATDLLGSIQERQEETDILIEADERITNLRDHADYLKILAKSNEVSVNFSDYNSAIDFAKDALENGSIEEVGKQLARAKSILAGIQGDIQGAADSRQEERVNEFAQGMVARLSEIVTREAADENSADRAPFIQELKAIIDQLKNAKNAGDIIDMTDFSSNLQIVIRNYNDHFNSDSEMPGGVEQGPASETGNGIANGTGNSNGNNAGEDNASDDSTDTIAPSIKKPKDITKEATGHLTPVDLATPDVSDNEDPSPTIANNAPANGFPLGTTIVQWKATDDSGNSATATQTVTITDTTAPSITAPADITIIIEVAGILTQVDLGSPTVSDLADDSPTITNDAPVDGFRLGNTIVTWTATDDSGNSATAKQKVTIKISVPPLL